MLSFLFFLFPPPWPLFFFFFLLEYFEVNPRPIISTLITSIYILRKDPDAGKDWRQEEKEKGTTEDEVVGWHHRLNGCEFEHTWAMLTWPVTSSVASSIHHCKLSQLSPNGISHWWQLPDLLLQEFQNGNFIILAFFLPLLAVIL